VLLLEKETIVSNTPIREWHVSFVVLSGVLILFEGCSVYAKEKGKSTVKRFCFWGMNVLVAGFTCLAVLGTVWIDKEQCVSECERAYYLGLAMLVILYIYIPFYVCAEVLLHLGKRAFSKKLKPYQVTLLSSI